MKALIATLSLLAPIAHASTEAKCRDFAQAWSVLSVVAERGDNAAVQDAILNYPHAELREALNMAVNFEVFRYDMSEKTGGLGEDREGTYRECVKFVKENEQ